MPDSPKDVTDEQWEARARDAIARGWDRPYYAAFLRLLDAERARADAAERVLAYLAGQYGRLLAVHERVVMDTPEDRELHARAVQSFKDALNLK